MVCFKRKRNFRCIYKWARPHITFAHKGIAERKKSERESCCSCIGLHLSNRSKVEGKVHFLTSLLPFTVFINHVLFIITSHFLI